LITEVFSQGDSPVHRFDPRAKLLLVACLSVVVALAERFETVFAAAALPLGALALARLPLRPVVCRVAVVNVFILALWLFVPFSVPGRAVFQLGPLEATAEGLRFASLVTLRSNVILLATIAFLGTSNVFALTHALSHFRVPDKLVYLFYFCYRYIHVIHDEYLRLRGALKARAFRPHTNGHTYKTYGYLVGMLLARSHLRAKRIYWAMLCRGFRNQFIPIEHFRMRRADLAAAALMLLYVAAVACMEWGGWMG